jgi:hypothetical protein
MWIFANASPKFHDSLNDLIYNVSRHMEHLPILSEMVKEFNQRGYSFSQRLPFVMHFALAMMLFMIWTLVPYSKLWQFYIKYFLVALIAEASRNGTTFRNSVLCLFPVLIGLACLFVFTEKIDYPEEYCTLKLCNRIYDSNYYAISISVIYLSAYYLFLFFFIFLSGLTLAIYKYKTLRINRVVYPRFQKLRSRQKTAPRMRLRPLVLRTSRHPGRDPGVQTVPISLDSHLCGNDVGDYASISLSAFKAACAAARRAIGTRYGEQLT